MEAPKKKKFIIRRPAASGAAAPSAAEPTMPITPGHYAPPLCPEWDPSWKTLPQVFAETPIPTVMPEELEVRAAVEEWYAALGKKPPAADLIACKQIGAAMIASYKLAIAELNTPVVHKPAYGTPEFWKQYWAKKKAAAAAATATA